MADSAFQYGLLGLLLEIAYLAFCFVSFGFSVHFMMKWRVVPASQFCG